MEPDQEPEGGGKGKAVPGWGVSKRVPAFRLRLTGSGWSRTSRGEVRRRPPKAILQLLRLHRMAGGIIQPPNHKSRFQDPRGQASTG